MSTTTTSARRVRLGSLVVAAAMLILTALFLSHWLLSSPTGMANSRPSPTSAPGASATLGSATPSPVATTVAECPDGFTCTPDSHSASILGISADVVNQISFISGLLSLVGFVASGGRFLLCLVRPGTRRR